MKPPILFLSAILILGGVISRAQTPQPFPPGALPDASMVNTGPEGSVYIPIDSWVYEALDRLHALGYVDTAYLGLRPWTRMSIAHMLDRSTESIQSDSNNDEARDVYFALLREVQPDIDHSSTPAHPRFEVESAYTRLEGIAGTPLRDSFHLGSTIVDDYGRPFETGFNNYSGFSAYAGAGRFSLYYRGEFQHAPSATGYSTSLASYLSNTIDEVPFNPAVQQATIPFGVIAQDNDLRIVEANFSYHLLGHEISFGKSDHWLGPDKGASMLWSNNAEDIYGFEINRVEPLYIPLLSRITGPFRYDFFVGSLKGHTYPNDPWVHMEKISFKPSRNLEFGFDRLALWGGKGHEPITLHTFLHSFFSFSNVPQAVKDSADDPGYRLGTFDFSYRLPFLRRWITLYTDSLVHDSVSPVSNPPRAGWHPGIYLARFPHAEQLDLRVEGANTDTPVSNFQAGQYIYWEYIQRQGPTNKGSLFGDWVGRQGKGGQAWLTWHLSPKEEVQFEYRNAKAANGFLPGGTTQNDYILNVVKRVQKNVEIRGRVQYEGWKAPLYETGKQNDTAAFMQITWFPRKP